MTYRTSSMVGSTALVISTLSLVTVCDFSNRSRSRSQKETRLNQHCCLATAQVLGLTRAVFQIFKAASRYRVANSAVSRFRNRALSLSSSVLTTVELKEAEIFWVKHTQNAYFVVELSAIAREKMLDKSHPFRRLASFVDSCGILRVGGRLCNYLFT